MMRELKCTSCSAVVKEDDGVGSAIWEARIRAYDQGWNACIRDAIQLMRSVSSVRDAQEGLSLAIEMLGEMTRETSKVFTFKQEGKST